jgi:glycosyltransferase involved in cell wall biosynthesis
MDADMQDPPELLGKMYTYIESGECDCVATRRVTRAGEPPVRSFFARCFYRLINKLSKTEIVDGARDYRIMTRQMVDSILSLKEYNRFSKGIFSWVGYRTKWLEYENVERAAGQTKWSFWKLFVYSMDGIVGFSTLPLAFASLMGILFCGISFLLILWIIVKTLIWGEPVAGYPSTLCIIFFIGGIQLFCIGILGQYLAKTYLESKKRPIYIVRKAKLD